MAIPKQDRLIRFAQALIDQSRAQVIVPPMKASTGFWFGGGNMIQDTDGTLWLVGRYRNHGDSRTGLGQGERGLELAIFRSTDEGRTFEKHIRFSKSDLNVGDQTVLSIEGSALRQTADGVELYVSTEKSGIDYPAELKSFLKPGTGVWTIDRLTAPCVDELPHAKVEPFLACEEARFIHVKDPFVHNDTLLFCTHPFNWSSSNTGYIQLDGADTEPNFEFFPRGFTWDVAMTRGTAVLPVPRVGQFADDDLALLFYDGGECVRNLDEHASAVKRPRGYSCEELGGLAVMQNGRMESVERLSINLPLFISPHGTGCSRYVDTLVTENGIYATWQQSQADLSQPLVMNHLTMSEVEALLA